MEKPACVDVCPTQALEVVELEEIEDLLRKNRQKTARGMTGVGGEGIRLLDLGR
jgi:Fe-S-cluster-containing hydrogenase component 2